MTLKERDELLTALRAARNLAARNFETTMAIALNKLILDLKRNWSNR